MSDSCCLSQPPDHCSDGEQACDPEHRHPSVQDDRGERNEEGFVAPSQGQESRASMPRSLIDEDALDWSPSDMGNPVRPIT